MTTILESFRFLTCQDFIQYYSAGELYLSGKNSYDPILLSESQRAVCTATEMPRLPWIPPHLIQLTSPLSLLPPDLAWTVWTLLSLAALDYVIRDVKRLYPTCSKVNATLLSLLFLPFLACLGLGQLGIVLMLSCWLLFRGFEDSNPGKLCCGILLSSFKPHLLVILHAVLFIVSITRKNRVYVTALAYASSLIIASLLLNLNIWSDWIGAFTKPQINAPTVHDWLPHTISGLIRAATKTNTLGFTGGLIWVLGLAAALSFYKTAKLTAAIDPLSSPRHFYTTVVISYLFAPYGWIQDQPIFLPLFFIALSHPVSAKRSFVFTRPVRMCLVTGLLSVVTGLTLLACQDVTVRVAIFALTFPAYTIYVSRNVLAIR